MRAKTSAPACPRGRRCARADDRKGQRSNREAVLQSLRTSESSFYSEIPRARRLVTRARAARYRDAAEADDTTSRRLPWLAHPRWYGGAGRRRAADLNTAVRLTFPAAIARYTRGDGGRPTARAV